MKEQIIEIMRREGLTANRLASMLGIQPSAISHITSGRNKPGYDFIVKLLKAFPNYNAEWMLTGIGEPQKQSQSANKDDDHPAVSAGTLLQATISSEADMSHMNDFSSTKREFIDNFRLCETGRPINDENNLRAKIDAENLEQSTGSELPFDSPKPQNHDHSASQNMDQPVHTHSFNQVHAPVGSESGRSNNRSQTGNSTSDTASNVAYGSNDPSRIIIIYDDNTFETFANRK